MDVSTLTIPAETLRQVYQVVRLGAATGNDWMPEHFTETMLIQPHLVEGEPLGNIEFVCTDGFRMHSVVLFPNGLANFEGDQIVIGMAWLGQQLQATEGRVTIEGYKVANQRLLSHDWKIEYQDHEHSADQTFNVGVWPNIHTMLPPTGEVEGGVGFDPGYLKDMIVAAMEWWEEGDEEFGALPLHIEEMGPQKVCTFSMKNGLGRLTVKIMPKIYDEEDI